MFEAKSPCIVGEKAYDIQPEIIALQHVVVDICASCREDILLMFSRHPLNGMAKVQLPGRLNLHEHNGTAVARYKVYLFVADAIVSLENFVAQVGEIIRSESFDLRAEFLAIILQAEEPPAPRHPGEV